MDYATAKEFFDYDPETGRITWRVRSGQRAKIGDVAGSINNRGYRQVMFKGKRYLAHRIAWLLTYKKWPANEIDHINGVPYDNRLCNLRAATRGENNQNQKSRTNTGVTGVTLKKNGYYQAHLWLNGKPVLATTFKNLEDAVAAVTEAKRKYHTFNPEIVTR
jgi:hypothetical protein